MKRLQALHAAMIKAIPFENVAVLEGKPVRPQDYIPANHYTSTHPNSHFTQGLVAALATDSGRVTLRDRLFRTVSADGETEWELTTFDEVVQVLGQEFGLRDLNLAALKSRLSRLFV